jgi:hypothetical protein
VGFVLVLVLVLVVLEPPRTRESNLSVHVQRSAGFIEFIN